VEWAGALGLAALNMVGYSSGAVLGAGRRATAPRIWDLLVLVLFWIAALSTRDALGRWAAILVWLLVALAVSALLAPLRRDPSLTEPRSHAETEPTPSGPFGHAWAAWKRFALRMGNFQGRLLMALLYFVAVTPVAVLTRAFSDPLALRRPTGSFWMRRAEPAPDVTAAHNQY